MVILNGQTLTFDDVRKVLFDGEKVTYSDESIKKVQESRKAVEKIVSEERIVYGITTGFGKFSDVFIGKKDVEALQLNLIRSHACGVGEPFPEIVSRAMILLRANALLKGFSGVRPVVIERLLELLNAGIHPVIPQQGSLGASGDLAPLSHLALVLIGEGEVFYKGEKTSASDALKKESIFPITLTAKEGLALINGTQAMTAMGVVAYLEAEKLAYQSELIASVTIEGLRGIIDAFDEDIQLARGYKEQVEVAERIRNYLADSSLTTKQGELRVQDAYSIRCIPQVHGATWQALNYVKEKLEIEMNAATDNPLVFSSDEVISGGNFHGEIMAQTFDFLKVAIAEIANISERRLERLVNPALSEGLPAFLVKHPGINSGFMIVQYSAASLVSENKVLAHPASVDSIPSSGNQEDHVSMGTISARGARDILNNAYRVVAMEFLASLQAIDLREKRTLGVGTSVAYNYLRTNLEFIEEDQIMYPYIDKCHDLVRYGSLIEKVEEKVGKL